MQEILFQRANPTAQPKLKVLGFFLSYLSNYNKALYIGAIYKQEKLFVCFVFLPDLEVEFKMMDPATQYPQWHCGCVPTVCKDTGLKESD